jgi:hypothetical protein
MDANESKKTTDRCSAFYTVFADKYLDQIDPKEPLQAMPSGMHFENMGQIFMRSGPGLTIPMHFSLRVNYITAQTL